MVKKTSSEGFTLVEVLVAMFVGAIIMSAIYGMMIVAQKNSGNLDRKVVTQQDTRAVLNLMAMEIRMASYNPMYASSTWGTIPSCAAMGISTPATSCKGIQIAEADKMVIAMDLNGNGSIGNVTDDNEYIMYAYDGSTGTLYRNVSCGGNEALLGGSAPFTNVINGSTVSLFQYFDKDGNVTTSIPDIRRILITIISETSEKDVNTQQTKKMVYSTSVLVRNHALSP